MESRKINIGIVGARKRNTPTDLQIVKNQLLQALEYHNKEDITIVSGGCKKGADRFAEIVAIELKINIVIFPAQWNKYGIKAGFVRNTDIARESNVLIALVNKDRKGGTEDTVAKFKKFHPDNLLLIL